MKKVLLGLVLTATMVFGSATIFKGTSQSIAIDSEPSGAKVYVAGQLRGLTPLSINLGKSLTTKEIRVQKEGYSDYNGIISKSYDPVTILNIVWDFSTTDFLTGAAFEYSPNNYYIQLDKKAD